MVIHMLAEERYSHTQRAPLCLLLYGLGLLFLGLGWVLRGEPLLPWMFPPIGVMLLVLAGSFHQLTVADQGDELLIQFGPIPLFRTRVKYSEIESIEVGQTLLLDGLGIHMSVRGGWVWNLWGRDCVVIRRRERGDLRVGTDEANNLAAFLGKKLPR